MKRATDRNSLESEAASVDEDPHVEVAELDEDPQSGITQGESSDDS